ncbi:hypothetical protein [Paraburkholderia sp. MM6662-R1]|uniref:hypothetical protein n=1 Tax=Paraburkholderia sp. MM6662-R1 TaxID=2991066 RepID=UPI003D1CA279
MITTGCTRTLKRPPKNLDQRRKLTGGYTAIERGVDRVGCHPPVRTALRVLAFIAFCNILNLAYTSAMGVHAVYADPWPADMPSWLANNR